jgi:hypothetical protein
MGEGQRKLCLAKLHVSINLKKTKTGVKESDLSWERREGNSRYRGDM